MEIEYLDFNQWIKLVHSIVDIRDKCIFLILYSSGCTEKELVLLKVNDIDLNNRCINFYDSAHKKCMRKSYFSSDSYKIIKDYLSKYKDSTDSKFLFNTRQSSNMTEKRIQQIVSDYSYKILNKKILPKSIRYTHIAHALKKNVPIFSVCAQTGLKNQRVMQIASLLDFDVNDKIRYEL